jgi:hypothetical protein
LSNTIHLIAAAAAAKARHMPGFLMGDFLSGALSGIVAHFLLLRNEETP